MVDNIPITAGSGTDVPTDDIGGVHNQKVNLEFGVADSATLVSASDPLPVVQTGALPTGDNNIGNVDVVTVPADPFGANTDAASASENAECALNHVRFRVALHST